MEEPTGYHLMTNQLQRDLVNHGWGELTFKVSSGKDNVVRVDIFCGKQYVFFIKKDLRFDMNKVL